MSEEAKTVTLSFGRNSIGQYQAGIHDENGGYRIAGGKYDGRGTVLLERELDARCATEIRCYLDAAFPSSQALNSNARLVECLGELLSDHYKAHVYEAWCDADKPNGRSAQREVDAIEDKARALLKELSHDEG